MAEKEIGQTEFQILDRQLDKAFTSLGFNNVGLPKKDGSPRTYYHVIFDFWQSQQPLLPNITLDESLDLLLFFHGVSLSDSLKIKQDWQERYTV